MGLSQFIILVCVGTVVVLVTTMVVLATLDAILNVLDKRQSPKTKNTRGGDK